MTVRDDGAAAAVLVQKYGGSSLATTEQVRAAARRIGAAHRAGGKVAVVVSAQGDTTDELLRLAAEVNPSPAGRELDQLMATGETASASLMALALQAIGVPAIALSGAQNGILATGRHGAGIIVAVDTERANRLMRDGVVVVVAGFQGVDAEGDVITLGRGGSDTSAVAIAAETGAGHCEIYTDVDGVYTADPRIVASARVMPVVDVDVMAEMSFAGAKVMHSRAVELAAMYRVEIHVGHSAAATPGTRIQIKDGEKMLEAKPAVMAVVHDTNVVRLVMRTARRDGELMPTLFRLLAQQAIPADMTTISERDTNEFSIGIAVRRIDAEPARAVLSELANGCGGRVEVDDGIGKLSIVGKGLLNRPDCIARMLSSLTRAGIPTTSVSTSQLRISTTVPAQEVTRGVEVLHTAFGLDSQNPALEPAHKV
ncbi:aspartate kinase [Amycolatopsis anabasis]|uniref:aspartate kinase n=1 Tax=Amycolatopsis anabasis TaxID=1840409 RepID=UPI00131AF0DD|nr:aspartate kinase [Amycolatopsis anabasis]